MVENGVGYPAPFSFLMRRCYRSCMHPVTIKILLNHLPPIQEYEPGDRLRMALSFDTPMPNCGSIERLLHIIFAQLNVDDPIADWAKDYRANRNRSLSVGDVVVIGEQAWACEPVGWKAVSLTDTQIIGGK